MTVLSTIRGNVRRNLGETTANFYSDAELNQYIGEGYKKYSMKMIDEGEGFFETTTNLSFVSGTPTISLTSLTLAFYTISQVERWLSNGSSMPLKKSERRFTINNKIGVSSGDAYRPTYKLQGTNLVLEPTPTASESPASSGQVTSGIKFDYNYVPDFPISSSADSFSFDANFPTIWEPLVELYATIRAMEAKDAMGGVSDVATFRSTLAGLEVDFLDSLQRDEAPESVDQIGLDYSTNIFGGGYF